MQNKNTWRMHTHARHLGSFLPKGKKMMMGVGLEPTLVSEPGYMSQKRRCVKGKDLNLAP